MHMCFRQLLKVTALAAYSAVTFFLHHTHVHALLRAALQLTYNMPISPLPRL